FQGNNYLEIEWGLLEPAKVSRTRKFQITTVNMQGGPNGDGTATITALDGRLTADKTNLINGKVFANPATLVPNSLKQTLFQVCAALDYDLEFDGVRVTDFPNEFTKYVQARTDAGG